MLTTIDYVPEQTERMASYFKELVNVPFDTPEFLTLEEMDAVEKDFWVLYDKSKYVADYEEIQKKRLADEVDYDELERLSPPLQKKYLATEDFDAKCIYGLELACYNFQGNIDYLGELIEDGVILSICLRFGFPGDSVPSPRFSVSPPGPRFRIICMTMPGFWWPKQSRSIL